MKSATFKKLILESDIYCFTFLTFITDANPVLHRSLFIKSIITFLLQFMLILMLLINELGNTGGIYGGNLQVNFSRIICALLLHILIVPEVKTSISMIEFAAQNPDGF